MFVLEYGCIIVECICAQESFYREVGHSYYMFFTTVQVYKHTNREIKKSIILPVCQNRVLIIQLQYPVRGSFRYTLLFPDRK